MVLGICLWWRRSSGGGVGLQGTLIEVLQKVRKDRGAPCSVAALGFAMAAVTLAFSLFPFFSLVTGLLVPCYFCCSRSGASRSISHLILSLKVLDHLTLCKN